MCSAIDWARAVQACAENEYGFHLVRGLCGHGYGRKLHAPPSIHNSVPAHPGDWPDAWRIFKPGLLVAEACEFGRSFHHHRPRLGLGSLAGVGLDKLEKEAIRQTLAMTGGNREQAANMLGIGERTLYRKLKEYGLK